MTKKKRELVVFFSEKESSEFFFLVRIDPSLIEYRNQRPMMMKSDITREIEKCIKIKRKKANTLSWITLNLSHFLRTSNNVEMCECRNIARSIESMPVRPIISSISSLLKEFTFGTNTWIFIGRVKRSSWKSKKWMFFSRLFLLSDENPLLRSNGDCESSIEKS